MLVSAKQYSAAIDAYLKLTKTHTPNLDELQRCYETALSLAIEYVKPRAVEVAQSVSKKMTEMNRWEAAAGKRDADVYGSYACGTLNMCTHDDWHAHDRMLIPSS